MAPGQSGVVRIRPVRARCVWVDTTSVSEPLHRHNATALDLRVQPCSPGPRVNRVKAGRLIRAVELGEAADPRQHGRRVGQWGALSVAPAAQGGSASRTVWSRAGTLNGTMTRGPSAPKDRDRPARGSPAWRRSLSMAAKCGVWAYKGDGHDLIMSWWFARCAGQSESWRFRASAGSRWARTQGLRWPWVQAPVVWLRAVARSSCGGGGDCTQRRARSRSACGSTCRTLS